MVAEEEEFGEIPIPVQDSSAQTYLRSFWCRACTSYGSAQQRLPSQHRHLVVATVLMIFFREPAWLLWFTRLRNVALNNSYF